MGRGELAYQGRLIRKIERLLPDCFVIKTDPARTQGLPDILILFHDRWGMLEVKMSEDAPVQPNQSYYVDMFNRMSFAAFIYPENEDEVLDALQSALWPER